MKTKYSNEFKVEVLEHYKLNPNRAETAKYFNIPKTTLVDWLHPNKNNNQHKQYRQHPEVKEKIKQTQHNYFVKNRETIYAQRREEYKKETKNFKKKRRGVIYSEEFKNRVLDYFKQRRNQKETRKHFNISKSTLTRWLNPEKYKNHYEKYGKKESTRQRRKEYEQEKYNQDENYRKRRQRNNRNYRRRYFAEHGKDLPSQEWRYTYEYALWQSGIFERDDHTCQECSKTNCMIHAHHIKAAKDFPGLRLDVNNGITLCEECHKEAHKAKI